jgi:hypothetical protein
VEGRLALASLRRHVGRLLRPRPVRSLGGRGHLLRNEPSPLGTTYPGQPVPGREHLPTPRKAAVSYALLIRRSLRLLENLTCSGRVLRRLPWRQSKAIVEFIDLAIPSRPRSRPSGAGCRHTHVARFDHDQARPSASWKSSSETTRRSSLSTKQQPEIRITSLSVRVEPDIIAAERDPE